ncbi:serpin family protein [soil metagenome]
MQRRTFLQLLAIPAVAQVFTACGDDAKKSGGNSNGASSLRGDAARVTTGTDAAAATAAVNAFADDLFLHLTTVDPTANLVFSPASIALALAMASAGAKGATLAEMDTVLHITDPSTIHRSMNGLAAALDAANATQDNTTQGGEGTSEVQLSVANSLWGQTGLHFEQAFLDLLSSEYGAGLELVDYQADPEAARQAINEWVASETHDRIPELLANGVITVDSRLTLVNAIYLKANWYDSFDKQLTTTETFAGSAGDVDVEMMHTSRRFAYAAGDGWQAVELPYVFGELAMVVAVGDTSATVMPTITDMNSVLAERLVELGFPKFDIETSVSLADTLKEMGMPTAFGDADFSGMTTEEQLVIGDVIHQANITVDEDGTEAAAATAVVMVATSAPVELDPVTLTIDRPFTFWLRARSTGAIVFMGRINDPSATRG